jgi:hypothetical protein
MPSILLGPMLRHVTPTTATIWVETDAPCTVEVLGHATRTFSVEGHHYALVIVRDLRPDAVTPYEVALDGARCWPVDGSELPMSVIRTTVEQRPIRILFGSCRSAAPHHPPYSLERDGDDDARGVDALWAHARRMLGQPPREWPDLAVFVGDQVYADDTSPRAGERVERRRELHPDADQPPDEIVADFEEYTWLYREAWSGELERWFLSVVPSAMIFDDHDVIDDWNISDTWVRDIRQEPWWGEHIIGALTSYWVHQHLGNLSPDEIEEEGLLAELLALDDGTERLRAWALDSEASTPVPGGYRFSHWRDVDGVRLVVVDSRNGRVLDPADRRMVDEDEWAWVRERALQPCEHLVIATSLPVFVPPGLHGLQQWNEAVCAGRWGRRPARWAERLRRAIDLEDWSAFHRSFDDMVDLLRDVLAGSDDVEPPATVTVLSGDIHFAYVAEVDVHPVRRWRLPGRRGGPVPARRMVHQVVSSPMRNALDTPDRSAIRLVSSAVGSAIGRGLARAAGRPRPSHSFEMRYGPFFANNLGMFSFDAGHRGQVVIEQAHNVEGDRPVLDVVIDAAL